MFIETNFSTARAASITRRVTAQRKGLFARNKMLAFHFSRPL